MEIPDHTPLFRKTDLHLFLENNVIIQYIQFMYDDQLRVNVFLCLLLHVWSFHVPLHMCIVFKYVPLVIFNVLFL